MESIDCDKDKIISLVQQLDQEGCKSLVCDGLLLAETGSNILCRVNIKTKVV